MMNLSLYPAKDRAFLAAQESARLSKQKGEITNYSVGFNRDIGRYIDVAIDGAWCPSLMWQEFHEEYEESTSGF
jgi:hypothetical protein